MGVILLSSLPSESTALQLQIFQNKTVSPVGKDLQKEFIVSTVSFHNITGVKKPTTLLTNRKFFFMCFKQDCTTMRLKC